MAKMSRRDALRTAATAGAAAVTGATAASAAQQAPRALFGAEEKAALKTQSQKLTADQIKAVEAEWPKLIAEVRNHMERGTDPKDPAVQKLASRWVELINMFSGGNAKVKRAAASMYRTQGPMLGDVFGGMVPDRKLAEYIRRVRPC